MWGKEVTFIRQFSLLKERGMREFDLPLELFPVTLGDHHDGNPHLVGRHKARLSKDNGHFHIGG